jgi:spore germination cell wall hydrolase CwlJ-like protein
MKLPDPNLPIEAQAEDVLLAMCIWGEARGQCDAARLGVANVVRNRVLNPRARYGAGWRGVILKPWQFSSFNADNPQTLRNEEDVNRHKLLGPLKHAPKAVWESCFAIAAAVMAGTLEDNTSGATHYFDDSLKQPPGWAACYVPTVKHGSLNFFRATPDGDHTGARARVPTGVTASLSHASQKTAWNDQPGAEPAAHNS